MKTEYMLYSVKIGLVSDPMIGTFVIEYCPKQPPYIKGLSRDLEVADLPLLARVLEIAVALETQFKTEVDQGE